MVERSFALTKQWRALATRYDKLAVTYRAAGDVATVEETAAFLDAYRSAARSWPATSEAVAWAAGIWVRAFNAKKQAADGGGPQLDTLDSDIALRLRHLAV